MRLLLLLALFSTAFGYYPNFNDNPLLDKKMKSQMAPHLLPLDHPIKPILDSLFSQSRITSDETSLVNAGFSIIANMPRSFVTIAKHPLVPGYVFKIYLDSVKAGRDNIPSWEWLIRRCVHAEETRKVIRKKNISLYTLPDKYLYPLPLEPNPSKKRHHPIILLATDMELESTEKTREAWKSLISHKHLNELYILLKAGYASSYLIGNIPYTKNGTFCIIDTEKPKRKHNLKKFEKYFSKEMGKYWLSLIE